MTQIPYGRQDIQQEDIESVIKVLQSDFLTQGPEVPAFEAAIEKVTEASFAVATNSATSALHLACLALDLGQGDIVWTSPITFVASANCARYCGAEVDFVDIEVSSGNMCAIELEKKLIDADRAACLPKIIIPVHLAGTSSNMERIWELAKQYDIHVIEDASHAIGARYSNAPVGKCTYSDITVFSFHPVKIITSGEGGVAVTQDKSLARRMKRLRSHGITREPSEMIQSNAGPWYYEQLELGWNYRMTDIQAALGRTQITRLHGYIAQRNKLANRYDVLLSDTPVDLPKRSPAALSAFHLYIIRIEAKRRNAVFQELISCEIGVNIHYIPVHLQPYYRRLGFKLGDFPKSERYYSEALSIPLFPRMTEKMQDRVADALSCALDA